MSIVNGKSADGKTTFALSTSGGLMADVGFAGGSAIGSGEGKYSTSNIDKANHLMATSTLENTETVGIFGLATGYSPN